jgi:hypothetical protein
MLGVPLNEVLVLAAAIIAGGVVAGLLAGVFGVGGGVIVVPVLYEIFRLFATLHRHLARDHDPDQHPVVCDASLER